jgi:multimeric flavodoxin WrbA
MMKVLALVASPRKLGNCEIMAKAIGKHIPQPHTTRLLRLHDFNIQPCIGCYRCLFKSRRCVLGDDLPDILDAMAAADGWIIVSPTYFLGANGLLKILMDRGLSFYGRGERLWDKPAVGVGIAGIPGKGGRTLLDLQAFMKATICRIQALEMVYGALPGEIFMSPENLSLADKLGGALFDRAPPAAAPNCPVCGGTTFQFLGGKDVRCMVCSNAGQVHWTERGPEFQIHASEHEFFGSTQDARAHEAWLKQMKHRFLEHKQDLKRISQAYRGVWDWVKPGENDHS